MRGLFADRNGLRLFLVSGGASCLALLSMLCGSPALRAENIAWIGFDATTASWSQSVANWQTLRVPGYFDDVFFDRPSATRGQVDISGSSANSVLVTGSTISAGNYVFHGTDSTSSLYIVNGLTLNNASGVTPFTVNGGLTVTAGYTNIGSGSTFTLGSGSLGGGTLSSLTTLLGNGVLTLNNGTLNGNFYNSGSASVANFNTSKVNSTLMEVGGGGTINIGANATVNVGQRLNIVNGTVNLPDYNFQAPQLTIASGGSIAVGSGGTLRSTGVFNVRDGAKLAVTAGGKVITGTNFLDRAIDIAVDGVGASYLATGNSTWGYGRLTSATFSNSAVGTFSNWDLGSTGGSTNLQILSSARVTAASVSFGGGTLGIAGGTFTINGGSVFYNTINLSSGGLMSSFGPSLQGTTNWSGGTIGLTGANPTLTVYSQNGNLNITGGGRTQQGGTTLNVSNGGLVNAASFYDIANGTGSGTLIVDGYYNGRAATFITGTTISDYGNLAGDSATITFQNGGIGTYNAGLRLAGSGGKAVLTIGSGAIVNAASLITGSTTAGGAATINLGGTLTLTGASTFRSGTKLNLTGGGLTLGDATIGTGANLNWSGGTLAVASGKTLTLDGGSISASASGGLTNNATLRINANGLFATSGFFDIATSSTSGGVGTLIVDGANARYTSFGVNYLARETGNSGTFLFSNGGAATFSNGFTFANNGGTGYLNVGTSSLVNTASITAGGGATSVATINIAGGTFNAGTAAFFNGSRLNLSAGSLLLGDATIATGANLNWTGGTLAIAAGKTLTLDGGSISSVVSGGLSAGATLKIKSNGSFNVAGGYFDIANGGVGTLIVDGANARIQTAATSFWSNSLTDAATVSFASGGVGSLSVLQIGPSGGKALVSIGTNSALYNSLLTAGNAVASSGVTINLAGGTLSAANTVLHKGTTINYSAGTLSAGALGLSEDAQILMIGSLKALRATSLTMSDTSKIDLADSGLIVDYTGTTPFLAIQGLVTTGRNGGNWQGNFLSSITARSAPGIFALGIAEAGTALGAGGGTFFKQAVDGTAILVRLTYLGDANLDGKVDVADLGALASHWQQTNSTWTSGDFNYDGKVEVSDLGALASNWQANIPLAAAMAQFNWSVVPEPAAGLLLLGVASVLPTPRSKRRS